MPGIEGAYAGDLVWNRVLLSGVQPGHSPAMNLHHLELFYYVCKHGGISRAVRHMPYGIQQPAVSSQILVLEQDLGVKLFNRQPFCLTPEGQELYAFARPFFDEAENVAARLREKHAPIFRIASSELILRAYLPPVIQQVREAHPGLRFALRNGYQGEMEQWLLAGEIDLAITTLDTKPKAGLKCLSITRRPLVLLAPQDSPFESAGQLWALDAIEAPLICLPPGESLTRTFRQGLRRLRVDWPTSIESSSTELITQYVGNGYGLGVTVDIPELIGHPKIKVMPLPGFDPIEIVVLWRPPVNALHDTVRAVIESRARSLWPIGSRD